ncbi:MAG: hypothetical protein IT438_15190 [Phycisphaerales bacterium]|nr:hypothetical protein [Phycisphaerales bacterium]
MSDPTEPTNPPPQSEEPAPPRPVATTTSLGRNWLMKTGLFLVLLFGFGTWGLADALYFYPRRGELDASIRFARHLQAAQADSSLTPAKLKCENPREEFAALKARAGEIEQRLGNPLTQRTAQFEKTRLVWLDSLGLMWRLNSKPKFLGKDDSTPPRRLYFNMAQGEGEAVGTDGARTKLSPMDLLARLAPKLNTSNNVTPLSGLDMLFQWIFVIVGYGGGAYVLLSLVRAVRKKYSWDPQAQRLTMPDRSSFTPADIKEVDKRMWHKFYATVNLRDGRSHRMDLLRYVPLEEWVLAMEKTAFPDAAPAAEQNRDEPAPK